MTELVETKQEVRLRLGVRANDVCPDVDAAIDRACALGFKTVRGIERVVHAMLVQEARIR